jgi:protocatechuate 3,4-dioxygenase beta subunit
LAVRCGTVAEGLYSDISSQQGHNSDTTGETYLRGYQVTDADGRVSFSTIYPGWYQGRAVHIHIKARRFDAANNTTFEFNTQAFFDDTVTDTVFADAPYNSRGTRSTRNADDSIYNNNTVLLLDLETPSDGSAGYVATFLLGLQMS